jgi:Creatinase/Prolidase N-terminal domain
MRRGLMQWNSQELPLEVLETRIGRLRANLKAAGLDGLIAYTNNVRPSAVQYLTAFTPYWSEGLLLVPMTGRPVFATALSNRVADWVRSTNPVSEVVSTPKPGALLGERLAQDAAAKRVGILEIDAMPAELFDDLAAAAPAMAWVDASARFAAVRRVVDAAEQRILAHADMLAVAALKEVGTASNADAAALAGLIEKHARLAGAEEIYVALAPDLAADRRLNRGSKQAKLADRFAVRASVAYKGSWVRRTRTFTRDNAAPRADAWFDDLIRRLEPGMSLAGQIAARVATLAGATLTGWMAESSVGSYPLSLVASARAGGSDAPVDGNFFVLTIELALPDGPWLGSAPLIIGKPA